MTPYEVVGDELARFRIIEHIYLLDLDHTLVKPRNGRVVSRDAEDYQWMVAPEKIAARLAGKITGVLIVTNQYHVAFAKDKLSRVLAELRPHLPVTVPLSGVYFQRKDLYRKPFTTFLAHFLIPSLAPGTKLHCVGDAAGRQGDFSDSDRKLALNLAPFRLLYPQLESVTFSTPEELFRGGVRLPRKITGYDPYLFLREKQKCGRWAALADELQRSARAAPTVVFLAGRAGSGRAHFAHFANPIRGGAAHKDKAASEQQSELIGEPLVQVYDITGDADAIISIALHPIVPLTFIKISGLDAGAYVAMLKAVRAQTEAPLFNLVMETDAAIAQHLLILRAKLAYEKTGETSEPVVPPQPPYDEGIEERSALASEGLGIVARAVPFELHFSSELAMVLFYQYDP